MVFDYSIKGNLKRPVTLKFNNGSRDIASITVNTFENSVYETKNLEQDYPDIWEALKPYRTNLLENHPTITLKYPEVVIPIKKDSAKITLIYK